MERIEITNSKILVGAEYNIRYELLTIIFSKEKKYIYKNVPKNIWDNFKKDKTEDFYSRYIKNKYKIL